MSVSCVVIAVTGVVIIVNSPPSKKIDGGNLFGYILVLIATYTGT